MKRCNVENSSSAPKQEGVRITKISVARSQQFQWNGPVG